MKGQIEKIWDNESRNGQRYLGLSIDGQRYTLWDEKYFDRLEEGDVIDFEWKKSGKFKNVTKINLDEDGGYMERRQASIIRMSCLKSASELIADSEIEPEKRADLAIEFARKFEDYVREDREEREEDSDARKKQRQ